MYVGQVKLAVLSFFSFFFLLEEKRFINHHRPDHRIWTIPIDKPEMSSPHPHFLPSPLVVNITRLYAKGTLRSMRFSVPRSLFVVVVVVVVVVQGIVHIWGGYHREESWVSYSLILAKILERERNV